MSLFTKLANAIFSPVDASGAPRPVQNIDVQVWGSEVERILAAYQAGGGIVFPDLDTANASLAYNANQMAWVMGDPVPANNGVYRKIGASGSGSWARLGDLPISMIRLDNAGAGTADAIIAEPMLPLPTTPGAALLTVNILAANTGSVTLNGKPLRTNSGNEIAPGGLTAGSIHAFLDLGDHFRLLSDQASAAIVAAAEAARDAAMSAVPNAFPVDRAAMKALDTNSITAAYLKEEGREGQFLWRTGDYSGEIALDTAEGVYIKADDVAATAGAWVRQFDGPALFDWFGAAGDGVADDTPAMNAGWIVCQALTGAPGKTYKFTGPVGSLTSHPGRQLLGSADMALLWGGADAQLQFCGEKWRLEGWTIKASGGVTLGIKSGEVGDNRGSAIANNVFIPETTDDYFAVFFQANNCWYSRFVGNFLTNSQSNSTKRGTAIEGNYSVNNDVSGNTLMRFANAIVWTDDPRPGAGHFCEGWAISRNVLIANQIHFQAFRGLFPNLSNNVIDATDPTTNPIISDASNTVLTGNWISGSHPLLLRNSDRHIIADNVIVMEDDIVVAFQSAKLCQVTGNSFFQGSQGVTTDDSCSHLLIANNIFTNLSIRAGDISLATDCLWSNNILYGTSEPLLGSNYDPQYRQYHATVVKTLGTETDEDVDFALPSGIFVAKPSVVQVAAAGQPIIGNYDFDDPASTATNVRVTISRLDGAALPGVPVRFSLSAFA